MSDHVTGQADSPYGKMAPATGPDLQGPGLNEMILFWASFLSLIAMGIGFTIRGDLLGTWGEKFGFTQAELGTITGGGLFGFGISIIVLSFFADKIGYGAPHVPGLVAAHHVGHRGPVHHLCLR